MSVDCSLQVAAVAEELISSTNTLMPRMRHVDETNVVVSLLAASTCSCVPSIAASCPGRSPAKSKLLITCGCADDDEVGDSDDDGDDGALDAELPACCCEEGGNGGGEALGAGRCVRDVSTEGRARKPGPTVPVSVELRLFERVSIEREENEPMSMDLSP